MNDEIERRRADLRESARQGFTQEIGRFLYHSDYSHEDEPQRFVADVIGIAGNVLRCSIFDKETQSLIQNQLAALIREREFANAMILVQLIYSKLSSR